MKQQQKKNTAPSLVDLCVHNAIDNLNLLGDVGETDSDLLDIILPHCTSNQLLHIENCTKERDLSPITNELWRKCFGREFGETRASKLEEKMENRRLRFLWRKLYEAEAKKRTDMQNQGVEFLKELCTEANNQKQSRRIQMCSKVPPDSKRRGFGASGSSQSISNVKGRLMKKAKIEFASSSEARMRNKPKTGLFRR